MNIKTSTEKWKYVASLDNWAQVIENATTLSTDSVLDNTVFGDCTSTQVKTTLSIDETVTPASSQGCVIEANVVKPIAIGPCYVKAIVDNAGVSSSGVRRFATPSTVKMNYSIKSIGVVTNSPAATSPSSTTSKTPSIRVARSTSGKSIASYAKLTGASTSKISLRITGASSKICKVVGTSVKGLKAGTCKVTVSVKPKKGATKSKTVSLKVTR